jgi:hypothetical protein
MKKQFYSFIVLLLLAVFAYAQQIKKTDERAAENEEVAFKAQLIHNGINLLGAGDIIFDSVFFNYGNAYHNNNGYFIAPSAGLYHFHAQLVWFVSEKPHTVGFKIIKNSGSKEDVESWTEISPTLMGGAFTSASALMNLSTGDTVRVNAGTGSNGTTSIANYLGDTHFFGYKVY